MDIYKSNRGDFMDEREKNNTRKMPIQREGVAYIPGGHAIPPEAEQGETRKFNFVGNAAPKPEPVPAGPKLAPKKKIAPAKNTNYSIIIVVAVFVAVLAAVFVFATMFTSFLNSTAEGGTNNMVTGDAGNNLLPGHDGGLPPLDNVAPPPIAPGNVTATGLIQDIRSNRIDIYVFDIGEMRSFLAEPHSVLRDRLGNPATLPQFVPGNVVYIHHAPNSNTVETAQLSAQVRMHREITGITVEDGGRLLIGNRRYDLGNNPIVRHGGQTLALSSLDPIDLVSVGTFQDTFVTSIEVHRSHGDLLIPQNEDIIGGMVEVGTTIITALADEDMRLRVPEGQNRVVIRGENIEPFIFDVTVNRGETANLNFNGLEFSLGSLTIYTETENAVLHVGDRWQPVNEPFLMEFGVHYLLLEAVGYHPAYHTVTIGPTPQEHTINLEAITRTRGTTVSTSPAGARVYIDEEFRGLTPLFLELEVRRHVLTLEREGFLSTTDNIHVTDDGNTVFSYILVNDPAWRMFE